MKGITYKILDIMDNQEIRMKYLIVYSHHNVMW
jgi:hypothetical protein